MTPIDDLIKRLREYEEFYRKRPSVAGRTPMMAEISTRECDDAAAQFANAADALERLVAERDEAIEAAKALRRLVSPPVTEADVAAAVATARAARRALNGEG